MSQRTRPSKLIYALTKVDAQASPHQIRSEPTQRKKKRVAAIMSASQDLLCLDEMSHSVSDQDASVLGKRAHGGSPQKPEDDIAPGPAEEDEDEDDIGPMPMPADASSNEGARKKRKGRLATVYPCGAIYDDNLVLPHEKLYLEHLPAADRYFKSFMHRDAVNFNITTK